MAVGVVVEVAVIQLTVIIMAVKELLIIINVPVLWIGAKPLKKVAVLS